MKCTNAALLAALIAICAGALQVDARKYTKHGKATWYKQQHTVGSCGQRHKDSDHVVALPSSMASGGRGHCGRHVTIHHGGKQINAVVADECPGCDRNQIDLSRGAFDSLADFSKGEIKIQWWFND